MTGAVGPMPRQNNQGTVIDVSSLNPDIQRILPETGVREKLGASSELNGQSLESVARQALGIMQANCANFRQEALSLTIASREAMQNIGLDPNLLTGIKPITDFFEREMKALLNEYQERLRRFLSGNSNTQGSSWGPNAPSNQNPQGPVLAA